MFLWHLSNVKFENIIIVVKHILNHFDLHKILTKFQHGFRSGLSCETQLLEATNDFLSSLDAGERVDVAILDFPKAFDTVPQLRLLAKLNLFGIRGDIHSWITQFLQVKTRRVVVDGRKLGAGACSLISGVL